MSPGGVFKRGILLCGAILSGGFVTAPAEEEIAVFAFESSHPDHRLHREGAGWIGAERKAPATKPYFSYAYDYFSVLDGGLTSGSAGMGLLDLGMEADLEELFGWDRASLVIGAFAGQGSDFSGRDAGDFGVVSNIYHDNDFNFFNIYYRQGFGAGDSHFKVGQIAADDDFMGTGAAGLFINSTFGPFNTQSGNMGAPIFPFAAPGALLHVAPSDCWSLTLAVYAGVSEVGERDNLGFDWQWGGAAGQAIFLEASHLINEAGGAVKLGGFHHTGEFEEFLSGGASSGLSAVYAIWDQPVVDGSDGGSGLEFFLRGSVAGSDDRAVVTGYLDGGVVVSNLFCDGDSAGLAVSHTIFGDDYLAVTPGVSDTETVIELTYQVPVGEYFVLQPDLQYVLDAHESSVDTLVGGIRTVFEF